MQINSTVPNMCNVNLVHLKNKKLPVILQKRPQDLKPTGYFMKKHGMFLRLRLFAKGKDIYHTDIRCKREVCFALLRNHKAEHMQLSNRSSHWDGQSHIRTADNRQTLNNSHSAVLVIFHHWQRDFTSSIYTAQEYSAIIYWLTHRINSWD